jgi:hypothetical protein
VKTRVTGKMDKNKGHKAVVAELSENTCARKTQDDINLLFVMGHFKSLSQINAAPPICSEY